MYYLKTYKHYIMVIITGTAAHNLSSLPPKFFLVLFPLYLVTNGMFPAARYS